MATRQRHYSTVQDQGIRALGAAAVLLLLVGLLAANSFDQIVTYVIVVTAALLPSVLWVRMGAVGIPIVPVMALVYIPYFALPVVSGHENVQMYTPWEVVRAGLTVAGFLVIITVAWRVVVAKRMASASSLYANVDPKPMNRVIAVGLAMGVLFWMAIMSGSFTVVGSFFGVVRSVVLTFVMVACFLVGVSRAQGALTGQRWAMAIAAIATLIAFSWSSLFLVGGMLYALAAIFGYVIVSRRVPWGLVIAGLVTVTVLHAGKGEMRAKYWAQDVNYGGTISVTQLPRMAVEWVAEGTSAIADGELFGRSVIDRASMLQMLLRTQTLAPEVIEFLNGRTYALLPSVLVPRFLDEDKPPSQAGMDMLNVHYGLLTTEGTSSTAIGWGLLAEAYANFGYVGVIGIALLLGSFCGALARWSLQAEIISVPTLLSIATMMTLIGVESDFVLAASSLLQSFAAVFIFFGLYGWLLVRQKRRNLLLAGQH